MAFDLTKTPENFRANPPSKNLLNGIYKGIVKDASDTAQFMGRLRVWIPELGGADTPSKENAKNANNEKYWHTVSYASPFAGATDVNKNDASTDGKTQQSYGWWSVPPDIGNQVLVCFANGDSAQGYWFACIYQQNMNHMIPAIGTGQNLEGKTEPVMEYNKRDPNIGSVLDNEANIKRHRFDALADGLKQQGLDQDPVWGATNTSARREAPSRTYGFLSPRGHSIHIDDGELPDKTKAEGDDNKPINEFIRLRTRTGVSLMLNDTEGEIRMVSKGGKSYLVINDSGVHLFTESQLNLRTTDDYNIQSGGDINIDAGGNLNIAASGHIAMGAAKETYISAGTNLVMGAAANASIYAGGNALITAGGVGGFGVGGNLLFQGAKILDGVTPPQAPQPLAPERHPAPDGAGGSFQGSTIGSGMPHHFPQSGNTGGGSGSNGGGGFTGTGADAATSNAKTPASLQARAKILYTILKKKGFTKVQIAAILGAWQQESGLSPSAVHGNKPFTTDLSTGHEVGLAQWNTDRKGALLAYAKSRNLPWNDTQLQVDFFVHELETNKKGSGSILRGATTLDQAIVGMQKYELFGVAGPRIEFSRRFMNDLNNPNGTFKGL